MKPSNDDLLEWALYYASLGWPVIPIHTPAAAGCSCGKPCDHPGKHPRVKWDKATIDPAEIREFWRKWPDANIAIMTGAKSGIYDIEVDKEGLETFDKLITENSILPDTPQFFSGGGGNHNLFKYPGEGWPSKAAAIAAGIDTRGAGALAVMPPSLHRSGKRYQWNPFAGPEMALADIPKWIADILKPEIIEKRETSHPGRNGNGGKWLSEALDKATIGNRNDTGKWLALQLRDDNLSMADALAVDYPERVKQSPGAMYSRSEWEATVKSIYSKPARDPAHNPNKAAVKDYDPPEPEYPDDFSPIGETVQDTDQGAASNPTSRRKDKTDWTIAELLDTEFPEAKFAIPGIIPEGLTIFGGRPKVGKSWFMLQVAHAVGMGGKFLDRDIEGGNVLYLALEDNPRRLKDRLKTQRIERSAKIHFFNKWKPLHKDGLNDLFIEIERVDYRLIVIDTLTRALPGVNLQKDPATVSRVLDPLQSIALNHGLATVFIDHTRKPNGSIFDPIDDIINSTEKTGIADAILALYKEEG